MGKILVVDLEWHRARECFEQALALDIPETSYQAALALALVLLHQHIPTADRAFTKAIARCRAMLNRTAGLWQPRYALATALAGRVVCNPRWTENGDRDDLLGPALMEYRRARIKGGTYFFTVVTYKRMKIFSKQENV